MEPIERESSFQRMSREHQQLCGQMWIKHVEQTGDSFGFECSQHATQLEAAETEQQWTSASHKHQWTQSCSSFCSSASTVSASTLSSAPSMSPSSTFGSTPCLDPRGFHSFSTTDDACESNDRDSVPDMPSAFWVGPCQWDSIHSSAAVLPSFTAFTAGMPSTCWVGPCPWESLSEEVQLEEYSLGSGYQESRNDY
jgi:hypothetical protein